MNTSDAPEDEDTSAAVADDVPSSRVNAGGEFAAVSAAAKWLRRQRKSTGGGGVYEQTVRGGEPLGDATNATNAAGDSEKEKEKEKAAPSPGNDKEEEDNDDDDEALEFLELEGMRILGVDVEHATRSHRDSLHHR